MTANIVKMPLKAAPPREMERLIIGGLLNLGMSRADFEGLGLAKTDFAALGQTFEIIRRLTEKGREVSPQAVFAVGTVGRLYSDEDSELLMRAAAESSLTVEGLRQLATALRQAVRGMALAQWHESQARTMRAGRFDVAQAAAELEAEREKLLAEFAPDDTAATDFDEVMARWDKHEAEGTHRLLRSGLGVLDEIFRGFPPTLAILLGAPGAGKTAVIASMILAMLEADPALRIGLFGLEDGSAWLVRRWLAAAMQMPLADVGAGKRGTEQHSLYAEHGPRLRALGERVTCYRRAGATANEIVRRASTWKLRDDIGVVFLDNLTEVALKDARGQRQDLLEGTSETLLRLRVVAENREIPVIVAAHTTKEGTQTVGPPDSSEIRGGQNAAQRGRVILGLWRKWDALRLTVLKANEGEPGRTVEFERLKEAALVAPMGGHLVDLADEKKAERKAERERSVADSLEREAMKIRMRPAKPEKVVLEPAKPPAPPAQASLLPEGA